MVDEEEDPARDSARLRFASLPAASSTVTAHVDPSAATDASLLQPPSKRSCRSPWPPVLQQRSESAKQDRRALQARPPVQGDGMYREHTKRCVEF
ncbi:hypothetical protein MTO96_023543 [Rhipicephalus appendiculatus]